MSNLAPDLIKPKENDVVPDAFQKAFADSPEGALDPTVKTEGAIQVPTTPGEIQHNAATVIAGHLKDAGFPQPPDKVSSKGPEHVVLAEIEKTNPGAEAVEDISHRTERWFDNLFRLMRGSKYVYPAEGKTGHKLAMNRIIERVKETGIAEKIRHLLKGKKAA